jgi:hypothetical protein
MKRSFAGLGLCGLVPGGAGAFRECPLPRTFQGCYTSPPVPASAGFLPALTWLLLWVMNGEAEARTDSADDGMGRMSEEPLLGSSAVVPETLRLTSSSIPQRSERDDISPGSRL